MEPKVELEFGEYKLSSNKMLLQLDAIQDLLSQTYWANHRTADQIRKSIQNSWCMGVYLHAKQVGYARVITDWTTTYYLCDVVVDQAHRRSGVGKRMVESITNLDALQSLNGLLITKDAHELYRRYGYNEAPEIFMIKRPKGRTQ